ncbi:MAG: NFACT family protein [Deltaproteobacteria bacterium]|nr:NFACT family protein [Deltaproteobacteria bacterium]
MGPGLLRHIVDELNELLRGSVISKVHQPQEKRIILKVFARGKEHSLLISLHPIYPRLHLTRKKYENPPRPKRFCAFLRSRIIDARIEGISVPEAERIVSISLSKGSNDTRQNMVLIAELTGKSSNIILVDSNSVVLDALRHFPQDGSPRAVVPGIRLIPLSPPILKNEKPIPRDDNISWNEAADTYYSGIESVEEDKTLHTALRRAVGEAEKRARRLLNNLNHDKEQAIKDMEKTKLGELLIANFTSLKKGMRSIEVQDIYNPLPEMITIPLDERLLPQDNARRYFRLAKKAKVCLGLLKQRIPEVNSELEYIEGIKFNIGNSGSEEALNIIKDELIRAGYLKELKPLADKKKQPMERTEPITKLKTKDGLDILVGKSGLGNDLIVKKYASPEDLWFHAKDSPGAHVLLKCIGKSPQEASIIEAAGFAARNSRLAAQSKAEVMYTEAKNLKKPKGAKPGMVKVLTYKTIMVGLGSK